MKATIEVVLFDAVGTLIFPDPPVAVAYEMIGRRFGSEVSVEQVGERFRAAFRLAYDQRNSGQVTRTSEANELARWKAIVGAVFFDAPVENGNELFSALWQHFAEPTNWRVFDDVQPTIEVLWQRGYRVGIASNFDERLLNICQSSPILRQFDSFFISSQVGWSKPAPEYYRAIEQTLNVSPSRILMIGDDEQNDVRAPLSLGWRARWLVRGDAASQPGQLTSLLDLLSEVD
ncbi:dUMP phosphatase [Anatilimnocola aggregata]|uniref:dUMP phosphatase n=1 Tax=Anatilimnocola aggregata TaxID=2528021 RepID=A0A517Y8F1_9BACT|nr:HAD-IA family hydrolase [Anatilimnocola aggregata]QDU26506.1 dUMP phosphatase [Anatilimnocola aggregata]